MERIDRPITIDLEQSVRALVDLFLGVAEMRGARYRRPAVGLAR